MSTEPPHVTLGAVDQGDERSLVTVPGRQRECGRCIRRCVIPRGQMHYRTVGDRKPQALIAAAPNRSGTFPSPATTSLP